MGLFTPSKKELDEKFEGAESEETIVPTINPAPHLYSDSERQIKSEAHELPDMKENVKEMEDDEVPDTIKGFKEYESKVSQGEINPESKSQEPNMEIEPYPEYNEYAKVETDKKELEEIEKLEQKSQELDNQVDNQELLRAVSEHELRIQNLEKDIMRIKAILRI